MSVKVAKCQSQLWNDTIMWPLVSWSPWSAVKMCWPDGSAQLWYTQGMPTVHSARSSIWLDPRWPNQRNTSMPKNSSSLYLGALHRVDQTFAEMHGNPHMLQRLLIQFQNENLIYELSVLFYRLLILLSNCSDFFISVDNLSNLYIPHWSS